MALQRGPSRNFIRWRRRVETQDHWYYPPLFFEGLVETAYPYVDFACKGIHDMLQNAGPQIMTIIPMLIGPIENALNTGKRQVIFNTLKALQQLVTCTDGADEALVPFFRCILPIINILKSEKPISGHAINSQGMGEIIADVTDKTLELFEQHGGKDAYERIKSMVPTYISRMRDPPSKVDKKTQCKPARLPPLVSRAAGTLKTEHPVTTRNLLSAVDRDCYSSKVPKQYLGSINPLTCLPPISKTKLSNYPSNVTEESTPRYSTGITKPPTRLPLIPKTNQTNYSSKVTGDSSLRHGPRAHQADDDQAAARLQSQQ